MVFVTTGGELGECLDIYDGTSFQVTQKFDTVFESNAEQQSRMDEELSCLLWIVYTQHLHDAAIMKQGCGFLKKGYSFLGF